MSDDHGRLTLASWMAARLIFALHYFGVGIVGFITHDAVKDAAQASTSLEKAMARSS